MLLMTCNYTYDITIYGSSCINVYDIRQIYRLKRIQLFLKLTQMYICTLEKIVLKFENDCYDLVININENIMKIYHYFHQY